MVDDEYEDEYDVEDELSEVCGDFQIFPRASLSAAQCAELPADAYGVTMICTLMWGHEPKRVHYDANHGMGFYSTDYAATLYDESGDGTWYGMLR